MFIYFVLLYIANLSFSSASFAVYHLSGVLAILHYSPFWIAVILEIPKYVVIFMGFFVRGIFDKVNKVYCSIVGFIFGFISFTGFSLTSNLYLMILFSLLNGISLLINLCVLMAAVMDYTPVEKRKSVIGFFSSSTALGAFLGPALEDFIMKFDHSYAMLSGSIYSLSGLLSLVIFCGLVYLGKAEKITFSEEIVESKKTPSLVVYRPVMPLILLTGTIYFTIMNFVPAYVLSFSSGSYFIEAFGVLSLLIRLVTSHRFSYWDRYRLFSFGLWAYLLPIILLFILHWIPSTLLLVLAGALFGIVHGIVDPNLTVLFSDITPNHTGNANFAVNLFFMVGGGLMSPLFGMIAHYLGFHWMFLSLVLLSGFYIFCILFVFSFTSLLSELNNKKLHLT